MENDGLGEVLFEMVRVGQVVKVTAIHPATGTEATIVGAATLSPYSLKANARRKLRSLIEKKSVSGGGRGPAAS
ncbi:MAG: hypothetical protein H7840_08185 [Alphaproteobacteria bacterium]